jgi:dynein heavy chain
MQGNKWLRGMLDTVGLRVLRPTDANFVRTVEASVRNGAALLLEDCGEELDSALRPVLAKQLFWQDDRLLIKIGDVEVDYDKNFRFFMTSKLRNPHYLPDVCIQVKFLKKTLYSAFTYEYWDTDF